MVYIFQQLFIRTTVSQLLQNVDLIMNVNYFKLEKTLELYSGQLLLWGGKEWMPSPDNLVQELALCANMVVSA